MDARLAGRAVPIPDDGLDTNSIAHLKVSLALLTNLLHDTTELMAKCERRLLSSDRMRRRWAYIGTAEVSGVEFRQSSFLSKRGRALVTRAAVRIPVRGKVQENRLTRANLLRVNWISRLDTRYS